MTAPIVGHHSRRPVLLGGWTADADVRAVAGSPHVDGELWSRLAERAEGQQ